MLDSDYLFSTNCPKEHCSIDHYMDKIVIPGMLLQLPTKQMISWTLGPGLVCVPIHKTDNQSNNIPAQKYALVKQLGVLKHKKSDEKSSSKNKQSIITVWLDQIIASDHSTSLLPISRISKRHHFGQINVNDRVLGIVARKAGEYFAVDIGCASLAVLHYLAFEGASKKNRPDIHAGDIVYATIIRADKDLEIELSCVDDVGKSSGMGILGRNEPGTVGNAGCSAGGVLLYCTQDLIRRLINQDQFPYLQLLSKLYPFEITMGVNGRIWLCARSPRETVILSNAISMADHISADQCLELAKQLC